MRGGLTGGSARQPGFVDGGRDMEEVYRTRAQACAVHGTKWRVVRCVSLVVCVLGSAVWEPISTPRRMTPKDDPEG